MQIERLFHVLVVGGVLLSGQAMADAPFSGAVENSPGVSLPEAQGELTSILCNEPDACVTGCDGTKKVKDGFECCWGTSCEDN